MRNQSGFAIAYFAVFAGMFIAFISIVIDLANVYSYTSRVKSSTDLAALAGISKLISVSDVSTARTSALSILNENLSSNIPNFTELTLASPNLNISFGSYSAGVFTPDEISSACNAVKINYTYTYNTLISSFLMINDFSLNAVSFAAKQPANSVLEGTSFPLVLTSSALDTAIDNSNVVTLDQDGGGQNSYFTDFSLSPGTSGVLDKLYYFQSGGGSASSQTSVDSTYSVITGASDDIYSGLTEGSLEGKTFIFPVGTFSSPSVTIDGYVGATVNDVDSSSMTFNITIIPKYIDSNWGGFRNLGNVNITDADQLNLLYQGFSLVN